MIHYVGGSSQPELQIHQVLSNLGYSPTDSSYYTTTTTAPFNIVGNNNNDNITTPNTGTCTASNFNSFPPSISNGSLMKTIPTHTQSVLFPTMSSTAFFYPTTLTTISSLPLLHQSSQVYQTHQSHDDSPLKSDDHEGNHSDSSTDTISNCGSDSSTTVGTTCSHTTSTSSIASELSSPIPILPTSSSLGYSEANFGSKVLYEFTLPFQCYPMYQTKYDPNFPTSSQTNIMNTATIPIVLSSDLFPTNLTTSPQSLIGTNSHLSIPFNSNYQLTSNKRTRDDFELSSGIPSSSSSSTGLSNLAYYSATATTTNCI